MKHIITSNVRQVCIVKKNIMVILSFMIIPFLLLGAVSAATTGNEATNKVSTSNFKDLTVTSVHTPVSGVKGCKITLSDTVKNNGNSATGSFWVNYYLKTNKSSSNIYIGHRYIKSLAGGASDHKVTILDVPINLSSVKYYLNVHADSHNNVAESNESNNYLYSATRIQILGPTFIKFDKNVGGDVTKNSQINNLIPKTSFSKTIFRLEKTGSWILKFGNGKGPKLLVSTGIHGNEPEPNIAIMKYMEYIKDKTINGTLYIIPFDIPKDTALNTRYYYGKDPNRIANLIGTPGWNIIHFARINGIHNLLDLHSGGGVASNGILYVNPSNTSSSEYKWTHYVQTISGCNSRVQSLKTGMIRAQSYKYGINTITMEVDRDTISTSAAAATEFKMINAALRFFSFPHQI